MKRKLLAIISSCIIVLSLIGCGVEPVQVNVYNGDSISSNQFGTFVAIGNNLVYDPATRIVYIINRNSYGDSYTPYYAPNGLPYRYNPETNTFEEI